MYISPFTHRKQQIIKYILILSSEQQIYIENEKSASQTQNTENTEIVLRVKYILCIVDIFFDEK